jgi:hypothetical protein
VGTGTTVSNKAKAANKAGKLDRQVRQLEALTHIIGKLWGQRRECVEAAALFAATASRLGIPVQLRAVSILAINIETQRVAITGIAAAADAEKRLGATTFGAPPDVSDSSFERAGHMIVTSKHLSMFFDPTFQQFAHDGFPPAPIAGRVADTDPGDPTLTIEMLKGRVEVTYYFDDANTGWQDGVDYAMHEWTSVAESLASHIRAGGTAADMPFQIPWDEQPARE